MTAPAASPGATSSGSAVSSPRLMAVTAAAVTAISRGELTALPEDVAPGEAAGAVMDANHLAELRQAARTSPDERYRQSAALLLAIVRDQVAREVEESDPVPSVRAAVHAMRERCR